MGKSQIVSRHLPAYLLGRNPDAKIIACSYSAELASAMNRDVQRIIDDPRYREIFPDTTLSSANVRTFAGNYLRNSDVFEIVGHKGMYLSSGVGGGITGRGFNSVGIIDDPIKNREEANSPTYRERIWDWYRSTFYTRREKGAKILLILTRWNEDDLAGRLLELQKNDPRADQWRVICFPAVFEGRDEYTHPEDDRKVGDALWPSEYSLEDLNRIKASLGSYEWASLYQQHPTPQGGGIFMTSWWGFYDYGELPGRFDEIIQSWDMTFKDAATSDFVVGQVWGRAEERYYLLDQVRDRLDFPGTIRAVTSLSRKWPDAALKLVEDKANGPAVISMLKRELSGLVPVEPQGSKEARAYAVSALVEAGNVFLPSRAAWLDDFITEAASFPNGRNDKPLSFENSVNCWEPLRAA
jgi:predicted phage terminase large subunit-like protein